MRFRLLWNAIRDSYIFIIIIWLFLAIALRGHRFYKKYAVVSAAVYIPVLLYVTLLGRTVSSEYQMELSFLWEYRLALRGNFSWWLQIFDNMLLFVPMGWLYGTLRGRTSWGGAAIRGFCVSGAIELCQLIFKLGLFEFDDIFNNTVGMLIGYGVCRLIARLPRD